MKSTSTLMVREVKKLRSLIFFYFLGLSEINFIM